MKMNRYTSDQMARAEHFCDAIEDFSPEKRFIALIAAESFINGMIAREHLDRAEQEQWMSGPEYKKTPHPEQDRVPGFDVTL